MTNFDPFMFKLSRGKHIDPQSGVCFLEAVAWLAGEPHSDKPECACPILGKVGISLNDTMTDEERKQLNPLILKMMNTRSKDHEMIRAKHFIHASVKRILSLVMEDRGWHDLAAKLKAIPDDYTVKQMVPILNQVRDECYQRRADAYASASAYAYDCAYASVAVADAYAYASADAYAKILRPKIIALQVEILNEAIELGPHNTEEFYDIPEIAVRAREFQEKVLERTEV